MLFGPAGLETGFVPVPASSDPKVPGQRHMLSDLMRGVIGFNSDATLVEGLAFRPFWAPVMLPPAEYPPGLNKPWTYGDWDTGVPMTVPDGPLINKPDEGSLYQLSQGRNPYMLEQGPEPRKATTPPKA